MKGLNVGILGLVVFVAFGTSSAIGDVYDAANDWSATNNPNGVWSYGWEASPGSTFNLYTNTTPEPLTSNISSWEAGGTNGPFQQPGVFHNDLSSFNSAYTSPFTNQLAMHPGQDGQLSVLRFNAPTTADYQVVGSFTGIDQGNKNVFFYVSIDGATAISLGAGLYGYSAETFSMRSLNLKAGDTVDLMVGMDPNAGYYYDTTGIDLNFQTLSSSQPTSPLVVTPPPNALLRSGSSPSGSSSVPEPSALIALFGLAAMGLVVFGWKRRQARTGGLKCCNSCET